MVKVKGKNYSTKELFQLFWVLLALVVFCLGLEYAFIQLAFGSYFPEEESTKITLLIMLYMFLRVSLSNKSNQS